MQFYACSIIIDFPPLLIPILASTTTLPLIVHTTTYAHTLIRQQIVVVYRIKLFLGTNLKLQHKVLALINIKYENNGAGPFDFQVIERMNNFQQLKSGWGKNGNCVYKLDTATAALQAEIDVCWELCLLDWKCEKVTSHEK